MKNKNPLVSIVTSTYNDEKYLAKAIDSVLLQTYQNWEFIIINDSSTDSTDKVIQKYIKKDKRFIYIKNKRNLGLTKSLNIALSKTKGSYIARLDGDDIWINKNKLKKQLDFMLSNTDYSMIGSWAEVVNEKGVKLYELKYPYKNSDIKQQLLLENCFIHSSVLMRRKDLFKTNLYNLNNETAQDYELWLELGRYKKLYNIPELLIQYRINTKGTSVTKRTQQFNETISLISRNKKYYPNYSKANLVWQIRKYYPTWLQGQLSVSIKNLFK